MEIGIMLIIKGSSGKPSKLYRKDNNYIPTGLEFERFDGRHTDSDVEGYYRILSRLKNTVTRNERCVAMFLEPNRNEFGEEITMRK